MIAPYRKFWKPSRKYSRFGGTGDFLRENEFEKLYIVGDLIDIWQLKRAIYWPQSHNDVI